MADKTVVACSEPTLPGVSVLQNLDDGFAIDVYNQNQTSGIFIDDIVITDLD
jgi:hypothetical protein